MAPSNKKPRHRLGDMVGLNVSFRKNADIAQKVGDFFGSEKTEIREIKGVITRKDGVKYVFDGDREFPVEWIDEKRVIPWEKIFLYVLIPIVAAAIGGFLSRETGEGDTLTAAQIEATLEVGVQEMIWLTQIHQPPQTPPSAQELQKTIDVALRDTLTAQALTMNAIAPTVTPNHTATIAAAVGATLQAFPTPVNK